MVYLKYNSVKLPVLDNYNIAKSSQEITFSDLKCDFTGHQKADLPEKYQEVMVVEESKVNREIEKIEYEEKKDVKELSFESKVKEKISICKVHGYSSQETREESKSTVTGTKVTVNDTYINNQTKFNIDGNSYQETTQGYNLYNIDEALNDVLKKNDDSSYTFTRTSSRFAKAVNISIPANTDFVIDYSNVKLNGNYEGNILSAVIKYTDDTDTTSSLYSTEEDGRGLRRYSKDIKSIQLYLESSLTEGTSITFSDFMIYLGSSLSKTYEPYTGGIPSPNPDYPQEITNVGGYDNLFDKNNIIDGSYVSDGYGAFINNSTSKRTDYIEIQANSYYYIYSDKTSGNWGAWYDKDKKFISGITLGGKKEGTVNSPANAKYIAFTISYQGNLTDYSNIKINETAIKIRQSGKNLFDKDNQDMFLKGLTPDNIGKIVVSPTNTSTSNYLVTIIVPCLPDSTYIISRYVEGKTFFVYESSKKDLKVGDNVTFLKRNNNTGIINEKITTGTNAKYLLVKIYNTYVTEPNTYNDLISSVQIEKGSTATPYEPYHEPIITPINLQGNILSKVGDVKDILKVNRNGEVEIKKNVGKVILDGSENWGLVYTKIYNNMCLYQTSEVESIINKKGKLRSNNFTHIGIFNENVGEVIALRASGAIGIALNSSRCPNYTTAEVKTWLSQHPTEVYYQLATPQIITLPSISPIELWQGTNIFSLVTNLDTEIELEYNYIPQSPSPEAPSEIKNVKENVRTNIRNKNFCDLDILEKLKEKAITINSLNSFTINLENGRMGITSRINIMLPDGIDKSKKYRIKYHRKMNNTSFLPRLSALYVDGSKEEVEDRILEADYEYVTSGKELSGMTLSWFTQNQGGIVTFSNISITEINENSDFEESKKQTIIFPFKQGQKLMQGDYLADDGIHHTRKQIVFNGKEEWKLGGRQFDKCMTFYVHARDGNTRGAKICNLFKFDDMAYIDKKDTECITNNVLGRNFFNNYSNKKVKIENRKCCGISRIFVEAIQ